MSKKSQAAMEFLLTYGWAILVVLIVIAALAYFGVLNPSKLLPSKCIFGSFSQCQDYMVVDIDSGTDDGVVWIYLLNNLGRPIEMVDVKAKVDDNACNTDLCELVGAGACPAEGLAIIVYDQSASDFVDYMNAPDLTTLSEHMQIISTSSGPLADVCNGDYGPDLEALCTIWQPGQKASIIMTNCPGITKGGRVKQQIDLLYAFAGAPEFTHTASGEIAAIATDSPFS